MPAVPDRADRGDADMSAPAPQRDGWVLVALAVCALLAVGWWAAIVAGAVG